MDEIRVTGIEVWRARIPLRVSFSHNLASRDAVETLFVFVRAGGATGCGQALPRSYLTGESIETVLDDIRERWWPGVEQLRFPRAADCDSILPALCPLYERADLERRAASFSAVEMAVVDAVAGNAGVAAALPATFDGAAGRGMPLVGVISAGGARKAGWIARIMKLLGYRRFKVKVGVDADADDRRLSAVRKVIGAGAWLAVDANAAWPWEDAAGRMRGFQRFGVSLVEEPLAPEASETADFAELERCGGIPIMADESLCTQEDAKRLLEKGSPSWWNLRFAKNGGFSGMSRLAAIARDKGISVYQGILVGETSALAAAARGTMFGVSAVCAEYGFPRVFLRGDPFRGGPGGFRGVMDAPSRELPGLGVTARKSALHAVGKLEWSAGETVE